MKRDEWQCVCCGLGGKFYAERCANGHAFCEICVGRNHHNDCVACEEGFDSYDEGCEQRDAS